MNTMKSFFFAPVCGLLCTVFLASCASGFYDRQPLYELDNAAFYRVSHDEYPEEEVRKHVPVPQKMPEYSAEDLEKILLTFQFERQLAWSDRKGPVFYPQEVKSFSKELSEALKLVPEGYRLILVSRYDPDKSVLSRAERVTAVIWYDKAGLNIVFGEIRHELQQPDYLIRDNWLEILPVSMRRNYSDLRLVEDDAFTLRKIGDFTHRTWAVLDEQQVASVLARGAPGFAAKPGQNEPASENGDETLSARLKQLEDAKEAGLITEKEYKEKRAEVIKEF